MPPVLSPQDKLDALIEYAQKNGYQIVCIGVPFTFNGVYRGKVYPVITTPHYMLFVTDGLMGRYHIGYWVFGDSPTIAYHVDGVYPEVDALFIQALLAKQNDKVGVSLSPHVWRVVWQYSDEPQWSFVLQITDYEVEYDEEFMFVLVGERIVFMLQRLGLVYLAFRVEGIG